MRIHLHRLLTSPKVRVQSVESDVTHLTIEGLACDTVCAARTRGALERIDGVREVTVEFETGSATGVGAAQDPRMYERAVQAVVVGMPLRRALERARRRFLP
jgi:copper chaperone CopZ